jgi:hypothetical protein
MIALCQRSAQVGAEENVVFDEHFLQCLVRALKETGIGHFTSEFAAAAAGRAAAREQPHAAAAASRDPPGRHATAATAAAANGGAAAKRPAAAAALVNACDELSELEVCAVLWN